jgi:cobalt-zinc-cadmium efflux system outer membrane protein
MSKVIHSPSIRYLLFAIVWLLVLPSISVSADQKWLDLRPEKPVPVNHLPIEDRSRVQPEPSRMAMLDPPSAASVSAPNSAQIPTPSESYCPVPRTLAELESLALCNNPTLAQAAARVRALQGKQIQAGLYPNPRVGYVGDEMGNDHTSGMQGASVGQTYITGGKLGLSQATVSKEIAQAQWACRVQQLRVQSDVRLSYIEFLTARQAVDLQSQLLEIGRAGLKAAESLNKAQEASRVDILQAKIEADTAAMQWRDAQSRKQAAGRRLAAVLGLREVDLGQLEGNLEGDPPVYAWEPALERLRSQSPELAKAKMGVARARLALEREFAGRKPDVDTEIRVLHNNENNDNIASLNVGVALPLFNRNQGNIVRAQAELNAVCREVERIDLRLQERLSTEFRRYEDARNQVETYARDLLPSAKQSLDLVGSGYRQGQFPYLDLLTSQRTFFRVKMSYLDALKELQSSSILIEGMLLEGSLGQEYAAVEAGTP